ncbi:outer membrane protein assembly factor BamB [Sansalvadorimonas sp. 2012CJ34-2]|uniref:Outer membrane protein assembly factor BamB n=1 Tax=Parendozoicomonas callyspongiae TaxID=2942213 RepID=A0ABT0PCB3_9GAMM|nr:outer membrane protein assembly factor BamB [Sansalvadorimonas sp. 2012CJ34-2]MCL6269014.1 outer membrane protein assembly factor BamB [Sansalvadorimonas sp. 2012CJ34-2]
MHSPVARKTRFLFSAVLGLALVGLAGCSRDGEEAVKPNPLPEFKEEVKVSEVWSRGVGDGQGESWLRLAPVVDNDQVYIAGASGQVAALDRNTGKEIWKIDLDRRIGGGTGFGEGLVLVGTRDGYVVALNATDGTQVWEAPVTSEVLAAPQAADGIVVVQTIDSKVAGLDAKTGEPVWLQEILQPVLTLRGTSTPAVEKGVVFAGFASGEARAYNVRTGSMLWDSRVAVPKGTSELERMVDVDSTPMVAEDAVYMVSYQGNVVALDPASGRLQWVREASSYQGLTEGFGNIYMSDADSVLSAVDQRTGSVVWSQKELEHRSLSGPAAVNNYVVAGDFEGYLHVVSQVDGRIVGRGKVDSSGVRSSPLVVGDTIYVYTNKGNLAALKLK